MQPLRKTPIERRGNGRPDRTPGGTGGYPGPAADGICGGDVHVADHPRRSRADADGHAGAGHRRHRGWRTQERGHRPQASGGLGRDARQCIRCAGHVPFNGYRRQHRGPADRGRRCRAPRPRRFSRYEREPGLRDSQSMDPAPMEGPQQAAASTLARAQICLFSDKLSSNLLIAASLATAMIWEGTMIARFIDPVAGLLIATMTARWTIPVVRDTVRSLRREFARRASRSRKARP